jgi:glyoxalase superfamily protein
MHLDLELDDVEAEVRRLEALGATRYDHQQERGYDFWVLHDPWHNELCVLQINFPDLLAPAPTMARHTARRPQGQTPALPNLALHRSSATGSAGGLRAALTRRPRPCRWHMSTLHDLASPAPRCAHKRQHLEQVMPEADD